MMSSVPHTHRAANRTPRGLVALVILATAVVGLLVVLLLRSMSTTGPAAAPAAAPAASPAGPATPSASLQRAALPEDLPGTLRSRTDWWQPGQEHDYGTDEDPFIRQPQDYGSDTPEILGNRISYHVYDLERVQDMVRRGTEPGSEIAQARGAPLTAEEREAARQLLQAFFDDTVPEVDGVIAGELTREQAYERIGPRRLELDRRLREVLHLSDEQFHDVWPHLRDRDQIRDQLHD
jgi:hypothetical protein